VGNKIVSGQDDIERIRSQEKQLVFSAFDEETALALGLSIKERAEAMGVAVAIDIRTWDRQLFAFAMKGTSPDNQEWIKRKINTVRRYHRASYALMLQYPDGQLPIRNGMNASEFACAGGGFPILVEGAGCIGCIAVSGLPDRIDHALVVEALCTAIGIEYAGIALDG
jgi:uncharacterized protein (UPF0303 family)